MAWILRNASHRGVTIGSARPAPARRGGQGAASGLALLLMAIAGATSARAQAQSAPQASATTADGTAATAEPGGTGQTAQAQPAQAQTGGGGAPATAAADDRNPEQVTITARRRVENVQDVPVAVSVLRGDDLENKGLDQYQNLQFEVPSTSIYLSNPRQAAIAIRGLGDNPAADGLAGSVGIYIDGIYLDRPGMAAFDLTDLSQIEVLRGPQGTLFGKNTTAGALNITTNKPTFTTDASGELTFGTYDTQEYKGMVNGPIVPGLLAGRVAFYKDGHDGYISDTFGGQYNDLNRYGLRAQFLYTPRADLSFLLRVDGEEENDHSGASILYNPGPLTSSNAKYLTYAAWTKNAGINPIIDPNGYVTDQNVPQHLYTQGQGISGELNWTLPSGFTLTSLSGFRHWIFDPTNDNFYTTTPSAGVGSFLTSEVIEDDYQASQEVRLASPTGGPVDFVTGGYYFWRRMNSSDFVRYPVDWSTIVAGSAYLDGAVEKTDGDPTTNSFALFGQANWHVDNRWTLTGGLRETYEFNDSSLLRYPVAGGPGGVPASLGPYNGNIAIANWDLGELFSVSYKINDGVMPYVSVNHGAKAGGFNSPGVPTFDAASGTFLPSSSLVVYPEVATVGEVGIKSSVLDHRLTLDFDAFLGRYQNYQGNESKVEPDGTIFNGLLNVGAVVTKGFELDASARPLEGVTVTGSGSYDLANYQSFRNAPSVFGAAASTQDLTGRPVAGAPRWTASLTTTYAHEVTETTVGYVSAEYSYKSGQYGFADDSSYSYLPAYGVANFRLGATIADKYDVQLWVTNAFNQAYFFNTSGPLVQGLGYSAAPIAPRIFGLTLRARL